MNDKLGDLISALFPGIRLTSTQLRQDIHTSTVTLEFTGDWTFIVDPESIMDPRILEILKAEKSAEEMREDKDNG